MIHLARISAATAFIILCTILPFLPGRYDSLALPLSLMAQLFGKVGLVLVPLGAIWIAAESRSRSGRTRYVFSIIALIALSMVWAIVSLGALVESITLGVVVIVLWIAAVGLLWPRLRTLKSASPETRSATPFYLVVVPLAVALIQSVVARPVSDFSRNRVIRNSAALIADIEQYRVANGRYPLSIVSVHPDYKPEVIGVKRYYYEASGEAYNLLFEHHSFSLGTVEIVMYNPLDQQVMTSHALDRLQLTPAQLALDQTRGHYAVRDTSHPHWKYFLFD